MTTTPRMIQALTHMLGVEDRAKAIGPAMCINTTCDDPQMPNQTQRALLRRGLIEQTGCPIGADWQEIRLTQAGRTLATGENQ